MAGKSTIKKLPNELRAEVDRLLTDGRYTIREVVEHLQKLGANVSWSAVQRHNAQLERVAGDIRMAREMAVAVGRELEAVPDGDSGRLVIESLQALLLRTRMQIAEEGELNPADVARLAGAARDLQAALRSNVDTELKIRERAAKDAAKAAAAVGAEQGLTQATVDAIRERILGIAK